MTPASQPLPCAAANDSLTVTEAAQVLGLDSFTLFSFIQRGVVHSTRSASGEITVPQSELSKLTGEQC